MANEISRITGYTFSASDELLLDTNVWLLIYAPHSLDDSRVAVYSQALADILAAKSRIYIDVLIVSEFINRYVQLTDDGGFGGQGIPLVTANKHLLD